MSEMQDQPADSRSLTSSTKSGLQILQSDAYHAVLLAFRAESEASSHARSMFLFGLRRELEIPLDSHTLLVQQVENDDVVKQHRAVSKDVEGEKEKGASLKHLQSHAYFCVLRAFAAQFPQPSKARCSVLGRLIQELKLSMVTHHTSLELLKTDPVSTSLRSELRQLRSQNTHAADEAEIVESREGHNIIVDKHASEDSPGNTITADEADVAKILEELKNKKPISTSEDELPPSRGSTILENKDQPPHSPSALVCKSCGDCSTTPGMLFVHTELDHSEDSETISQDLLPSVETLLQQVEIKREDNAKDTPPSELTRSSRQRKRPELFSKTKYSIFECEECGLHCDSKSGLSLHQKKCGPVKPSSNAWLIGNIPKKRRS